MILKSKNWSDFQHYKDRAPPWIKLHKKLLDDRAFHQLPDASRALAPCLWLLCSEADDGSIKDAVQEIAFRLRMTERRVREALEPLISAGFFYVEQSDSAPLAERKQNARLVREERETEVETEGEERERGADAPQPAKRGDRIPDDWSMTDDGRNFAQGLGLDPTATADAFADHWRAADGPNARKRDWNAAFRTWCRRAVGDHPRTPQRVRAARGGSELTAFARGALGVGRDEPVQ